MMSETIVRGIARAEADKAAGFLSERIGKGFFEVQTLDATPVNAAVLELPEGVGGDISVKVFAVRDDAAGAISGRMEATFLKVSSLTIQTITDLHKDVSGITGADFTLVVDDENIAIEVTGTTDVINWGIETELLFKYATTLP